MEIILVIFIVVIAVRLYEKRGGTVDYQDHDSQEYNNHRSVQRVEPRHQEVHHYHHAPPTKKGRRGSLRCPKCKSIDVNLLDENRKGFSVGKAIVGSVITSPVGGIGGLAGFTGGKRKKKIFTCQNCGHVFKFKVR